MEVIIGWVVGVHGSKRVVGFGIATFWMTCMSFCDGEESWEGPLLFVVRLSKGPYSSV